MKHNLTAKGMLHVARFAGAPSSTSGLGPGAPRGERANFPPPGAGKALGFARLLRASARYGRESSSLSAASELATQCGAAGAQPRAPSSADRTASPRSGVSASSPVDMHEADIQRSISRLLQWCLFTVFLTAGLGNIVKLAILVMWHQFVL